MVPGNRILWAQQSDPRHVWRCHTAVGLHDFRPVGAGRRPADAAGHRIIAVVGATVPGVPRPLWGTPRDRYSVDGFISLL
jgi:hypothetical protein